MIKLFSNGAYLINNKDIVEDCNEINSILKNKIGDNYPSKEEAKKNTIAYNILKEHNTSENMDKLKIKFYKYMRRKGWKIKELSRLLTIL